MSAPRFFLQRDTRAPAKALAFFVALIVGRFLAAGPVGKRIAGGFAETSDEIANKRTALVQAFD